MVGFAHLECHCGEFLTPQKTNLLVTGLLALETWINTTGTAADSETTP